MALVTVAKSWIVANRGLHIDFYNLSEHVIINLQDKVKSQENDYIVDVALSSDEKQLALVTSSSKTLLIFNLDDLVVIKSFELPKTASRIRFTPESKKILVADKNGDVLLYDLKSDEGGTKILGHLSLLLDVLQTSDEKFIISSDRDEKIKVSCYPHTYNIHSYCLGHTEFVNHLELLPHNIELLTSTSGDGTIKFWKYTEGKLLYTIDTTQDIKEIRILEDFAKVMDNEGVEVNKLPIVLYTVSVLNDNTSLLVVSLHNYNDLLLYSLTTENTKINHKLEYRLTLKESPAAVKFYNSNLYVYDDIKSEVIIFNVTNTESAYNLCEQSRINMFTDKVDTVNSSETTGKFIRALYKRKFDNVQEYLKRKMLRLEKKI